MKEEIFVLLAHPGGPFWENKDLESWSIPKGEFTDDDNALAAAVREFEEETGTKLQCSFIELALITLKSGKIIYAWACEENLDTGSIKSNEFELEWPPKSGILKSYPEIDAGAWFNVGQALEKINSSQAAFIRDLLSKI